MIIFQNQGLIDLRAVKTVGLNAKPKTDNPIGEFGTGLKLAIAVILRNKGHVTLYRGKQAYMFGVKQTKFRGEEVQLITMNGEDLGFTLNYGKNWKPWQAFRELYSNMLDEPEGKCSYTKLIANPKPGYTTIVVDGCEFDELYENRRSVFLEGDPLLKVPGLEVHFGQSKAIYYNGMRAMDLPQPSLFTYNITSRMTLTEDRTFMYPHMAPYYTVRALAACDNGEIIANVLTADKEAWESRFEYDLGKEAPVSGTFMRVAADLKARRQPMVAGASKLFADRATQTSTYGMVRTRSPSRVELAHYEQALEMVRMKLPNIDTLPCVVANDPEAKDVYANQEFVELAPGCADMTILDLAVKIVTALCNREAGKEPTAQAVARMFLLGSFERRRKEEEQSPFAEADIPF